jgi:hypothetical protein
VPSAKARADARSHNCSQQVCTDTSTCPGEDVFSEYSHTCAFMKPQNENPLGSDPETEVHYNVPLLYSSRLCIQSVPENTSYLLLLPAMCVFPDSFYILTENKLFAFNNYSVPVLHYWHIFSLLYVSCARSRRQWKLNARITVRKLYVLFFYDIHELLRLCITYCDGVQ